MNVLFKMKVTADVLTPVQEKNKLHSYDHRLQFYDLRDITLVDGEWKFKDNQFTFNLFDKVN